LDCGFWIEIQIYIPQSKNESGLREFGRLEMIQNRPTQEEFRKTLWRAALPPLLLLAALAGFVGLLLFQLLRAGEITQQSEEALAQTYTVERLLITMETGMRGYLLSRDDQFLEPYDKARTEIGPALDRLDGDLQRAAVGVDHVSDLKSVFDQWFALEPQLRADRLSPVDPAVLEILRQRKVLMDQMRGQIADMVSGETVMLQQQNKQFQRASTLAVLGSIGLSMSLGIGLALLNRRTIVQMTTAYQGAREAEELRTSDLAASNQQFLDLAEAIPQLVWISDGTGKAVYFNSPWGPFTGSTLDELSKQGWQLALHPEDRNSATARWKESVEGGNPFEAEYRLKQASDGSYRWFLCRATPVRDKSGKSVRWFGSCTDIHSQKQLEHDREELLAAERKARSDLLRTNIIKDQFLATLSHELRTPMTAILGWTQLLRDPVIREASLDRAIEAIDSNAKAQARLIEDLLDMSRILSGKLTIKPESMDLKEGLQAAIDAVGPAVLLKQLTLEQDVPQQDDFRIQGDPTRLQQVMSNLLSNAVKFTPAGGKVQVSLQRDANLVTLKISDTGRGIRPEFLPHVFERFRQADGSTTRQHGGLGLGLAIVKHLVEMHGGHASAESAGEEKGATFTVQLPVNAPIVKNAPKIEAQPNDGNMVSLKGLRILLVEDDAGSAEVVRAILEHAGAEVEAVSSGIAGLKSLAERQFDVLISDIGMPQMDGYGLIRRVREIEPGTNRHIQAIALTAFASKDDRQEALAAGYQMHLAKPVAPGDLTRAVASVVRA
jgi:PAS domain S-box-containing protein